MKTQNTRNATPAAPSGETSLPIWYAARSASDHQGIVADETTGATIAVVYDKQNAPLLAAAPELLAALEAVLTYEDDRPAPGTFGAEIYRNAQAALAKARGL